MSTYQFREIELKWQRYWVENKTFRTPHESEPGRESCYVLDMFPYPSGKGLHVGHPLGYIATDIVARYKRMRGVSVLHPIGFDAFGLPAEQFAVENGVHPRTTTERNIQNMLGQLQRLGLSYDWDRVFATTDPEYYRWTQWIFLQVYNSYVDPESGKVHPIGNLVAQLETGNARVDDDGCITGSGSDSRFWSDLDSNEKARVLAAYRLAYLDEVDVNWCPALGTVLANEEVTNNGRSERGNHPVFRRPLRQWMLRITAMADRLNDDLELVDWPEPVKQMQRNWIGRSEGATAIFEHSASSTQIPVFTTRPDTLFGATYVVLAPEHPAVALVTTDERKDDVSAYQERTRHRTEMDRMVDTRIKTGVFTGGHAVNPVNGAAVPIWVADYVLMGYGTGAIMAVPAHDDRDFEFATQFELPVVAVVRPPDEWLSARGVSEEQYRSAPQSVGAYAGMGVAVASSSSGVSLDGLETMEAKARIIAWLCESGNGAGKVQYKLRDWLFSRQRYWGEPFPILHGPDGEIRALEESDLPVLLPEMEDFAPSASDDPAAAPRPPLGRSDEEWRIVELDGKRYERELNTMPQWAGSCWYYLRFIDPRNESRLVDPDLEKYWMSPMGVDLYVGGVEHAVLHLLYARFWHKLLYDLGEVSTPEPFGRLFNQGYIQAFAYRDERGIVVPVGEVVDQDGNKAIEVQDQPDRKFFYRGAPVKQDYGKMGKSLKNAVSPDEVSEEYGCDTLRLYEMYLGPVEQSKPWSTRDIVGVNRFLRRVWRLFVDDREGTVVLSDRPPGDDLVRLLHRTIQRVTHDVERMSFNTAIAAMIEFVSAASSEPDLPREVANSFLRLLAPFAPHIAEELWELSGETESVAYAAWPEWNERFLVEDTMEIAIQVNGKVRGSVSVPRDASKDVILEVARTHENVTRHVKGKELRRQIYVPGKIVNFVVAG